MKKVNSLVIGLLMALLFLSSCKEDDPEPEEPVPASKSDVEYDGTKFDFIQAIGLNLGDSTVTSGSYRNIDVSLVTEGLAFVEDSLDIEGEGNQLYLELFTKEGSKNLVDGTYTFGSTVQEFGFTDGYFALNYNTKTEEVDDEFDVISGTVTQTTLTGGKVQFDLDLTLDNGKKLEGVYVGTIQVIDIEELIVKLLEDLFTGGGFDLLKKSVK